jgi:hypothetical protein
MSCLIRVYTKPKIFDWGGKHTSLIRHVEEKVLGEGPNVFFGLKKPKLEQRTSIEDSSRNSQTVIRKSYELFYDFRALRFVYIGDVFCRNHAKKRSHFNHPSLALLAMVTLGGTTHLEMNLSVLLSPKILLFSTDVYILRLTRSEMFIYASLWFWTGKHLQINN